MNALKADTRVFDFAWDDTADLGVWVDHPEHPNGICVEAGIRTLPAGEGGDNPTGELGGEYQLASAITLSAGDGVITHKNEVLSGRDAQTYLARMVRIEREGKQAPVNAQQARALGVAWEGE